MAASTYILCPGQGAQVVGMGKDLHEAFSVAREVFDSANQILGWDLASICFGGPEERIHQTDVSQPALYVTGVASFRAACEAGIIDAKAITAFAGLSLGEYTALHLSGACSFEEGLRLVAIRGRAMQDAATAVPSGMVALIGPDEETVARLCRESAGGEVLVPANYNAPGQIVVSGSSGACSRIVAAAEAAGIRAMPLKVAGAFHSPLMQPAADRMKSELEKIQFSSPASPVYSNVTGAPHKAVDAIGSLLVAQIVSPVQWERTMQTILADGAGRFVELGPGRTLAGLAKRINRRAQFVSVGSVESIALVKAEALS